MKISDFQTLVITFLSIRYFNEIFLEIDIVSFEYVFSCLKALFNRKEPLKL